MRSTCTYTLVPQDRVRVEWRGDGHLSLWTEDARLCVRIEGAERAREIGQAILAALPGGAPSAGAAALVEAFRVAVAGFHELHGQGIGCPECPPDDDRGDYCPALVRVNLALAPYEAKD